MITHRITDLIDHITETDLTGPLLPRVELAQALLEAANDLLYHAAREAKRRDIQDYVVEHLGHLIGDGARRSHAPTVADWIEDLEDGDAGPDEDGG